MSLGTFLETYSSQLTAKIAANMTPVYDPLRPEKVEDFILRIPKLLRKPYPVQGEIVKGVSKALYREKRLHLFIVGEMGSGKTLIGLSIIQMADRPMRTLVISPTHLVEKWKREAKQTVPDVEVIDLAVPNAVEILRGLRSFKQPPKTHQVFVISKERAKLSYGWRPLRPFLAKGRPPELPYCPKCGEIPKRKDKDGEDIYMTWGDLKKKRQKCGCGEVLWQADSKLRRFSPAEYIKNYMKGFFDLVILDEIQDYKAQNSLQGRAMGALLTASERCLCLTGTLNGGYADDTFYLLFRLDPKGLLEDGFGYGNGTDFLKAYGTLEEVHDAEEEDNYYGRGRKKNVHVRRRPGVSPAVIGRYLLNKACFIRLADVIEGLPPYEESVVNVEMGVQKVPYMALEADLKEALREHGKRSLGAMLQALLSYPDTCALYEEHIEIKDRQGVPADVVTAPKIKLKKGELLPKEKELLGLVASNKQRGRKVLCYVSFTDKRDTRPRLRQILEDAGYKVGILESSVEPKKREAWIDKHARGIDVLICNPELVKTGLDLIDFPTVVFYQVGYNIFTLRQAARRSWRIGQPRPVEVHFFCYQDSMQETALTLIAQKLEVALMVEGDLPEGLAEYGTSAGSLTQELGKALLEGGNYGGAEKAWANFRKQEIQAQLQIGGTQTVFSATDETGKVKPASHAPVPKTSIEANTLVKVTVLNQKGKKTGRLEVRYFDLEKELEGQIVQFAMF